MLDKWSDVWKKAGERLFAKTDMSYMKGIGTKAQCSKMRKKIPFLKDVLTMYDIHDSTDTLKFWTEKRAINKTFFVFHPILMKLGEIEVYMDNYNFTKFIKIKWKQKKFY